MTTPPKERNANDTLLREQLQMQISSLSPTILRLLRCRCLAYSSPHVRSIACPTAFRPLELPRPRSFRRRRILHSLFHLLPPSHIPISLSHSPRKGETQRVREMKEPPIPASPAGAGDVVRRRRGGRRGARVAQGPVVILAKVRHPRVLERERLVRRHGPADAGPASGEISVSIRILPCYRMFPFAIALLPTAIPLSLLHSWPGRCRKRTRKHYKEAKREK